MISNNSDVLNNDVDKTNDQDMWLAAAQISPALHSLQVQHHMAQYRYFINNPKNFLSKDFQILQENK